MNQYNLCYSYRFILDNPTFVKGKRVIDIGSGCGASAIASVMCGASYCLANDVCPGMYSEKFNIIKFLLAIFTTICHIKHCSLKNCDKIALVYCFQLQ